MAFYALYKWFRPWRKTPYINWIQWYRKYLFNQWYNSLTEEQKEEYQKMKEEERKRNRDKYYALLNAYATILSRSPNSAYYFDNVF